MTVYVPVQGQKISVRQREFTLSGSHRREGNSYSIHQFSVSLSPTHAQPQPDIVLNQMPAHVPQLTHETDPGRSVPHWTRSSSRTETWTFASSHGSCIQSLVSCLTVPSCDPTPVLLELPSAGKGKSKVVTIKDQGL